MSVKIFFVAIAVALFVAAELITPAEAASKGSKNPCMNGWTGPSKHNSIACDGDYQAYAVDSGAIYIGIPFLIGFITLFPCCCVFICGRYCCQCLGGSKMRPATTCCECCCGNAEYDGMPEEEKINLYPMYSTIIVKALTAACFIVCVVALILGILGGLKTKNNAQTMVDAFGDGFQVFINMADDLNRSIHDPNDGSVPAGFDASQFGSFKSDMESQKKDLTSQMQPVADGMATYALIPAFIIILPTVCLLAALISAICNIRSVLPLLVILCNFFLQFLYFFVATIILLALFPVEILCHEVTAEPHEKSILNWMLIPQCEDTNPLKSLNDQVVTMETDGSREACTGLLEICNTNPIWNLATREKIFVCNITSGSDCSDFATVAGTLSAMYLKAGSSVYEDCGGISPCTVRNCSTSCSQSDTRNFARDSIKSVDAVTRMLAAYRRIITPFLSCAKLFALVLNSGPKQGCEVILSGLHNFKDGLLMCGSACWFSIFVLFLGQKRFSCPDASKAPDAILPGDEYNEANGNASTANGKVLSPMGTTMNSTTFGNSTNPQGQAAPYGASGIYGGGGYYDGNNTADASSPVNNDYPSKDGDGGYPAAISDDISKANEDCGYPAPEEAPRNTSSPAAVDHYQSPPLGVESEMNDMET